MITEEQARAAMDRLCRWDDGEPASEIYPEVADSMEAANNDAWDLARYCIAKHCIPSEDAARAAWREYRRRLQRSYIVPPDVLDMLDQWADDDTDPPDDGPITKEQADPVKHLSRYHRQFQGVTLDLYRIAKLWGVASHALFHAMKKIMMAGGRGHKDKVTDLKEAIVSIEEELKMMEEEDDRKEI